jgi:predicted AlkP superfamily phosphohydrolase/phosphomutase/tetratricopeptide (TPR) repeat protein
MTSRRVLLVGWDAADWKVMQPLMAAGKLPNVQRLVGNGAAGQIATLHPPLSPMLWTSIATGKRPFQHGIHGFTEPAPDGSGVQPITNLSRKSKALWNILSQNNLRSVVIGWWPSHPVEPINGVMVSDHYHRAAGPLDKGWPMPADTVHPAELTERLASLRMHPDLITPEMVEPFIPLAREIDQDEDKRLALFLRTLAECMSIQSAAIWLLDNQPWDFFAVYFEAVDHFCHGFMRYHPPRQPWIGSRDFEFYHNVVSMAYQFHDEMLGALMRKAGDDAIVILMSDHGFHPDHLRPASIPDIPAGPAIEHRDYGVFAIAGPGIKKDQVVHGLSLLDVVPTILNAMGLPVGEDMDGKVLSQLFVEPPNVEYIPSWEEVPGADGRHPPHTRLDPVAAHEAMEQMIALGYIERPNANCEMAIRAATRDLRYNLGEAYQDDGRHVEAYEIFTELYQADRDEQRFGVRLFVSCQALGLHQEMRRIVDDLDGRRRALYEEAQRLLEEAQRTAGEARHATLSSTGGDHGAQRRELARWRNLARFEPAVIDYLKAQISMVEKRYAEALAALERVTETNLIQPGVYLQAADLCLRLGRRRDAQQIYAKALAIDPDNAHAHIGLSRIALRQRRYSIAADLALEALQRTYQDPLPHYLLGRALAGMKEYQRAAEALRAAISLNPNFPEAHSLVAALLEEHLGDAKSAGEHRRLAHIMRQSRSSRPVGTGAAERAQGASALPAPLDAPLDAPPDAPLDAPLDAPMAGASARMPPLSESLIVVTGLPRSGTSLLMQMLAAGGVSVLQDDLRPADEDNPRGYLEFEPVRNLLKDSQWLSEARGKAIKIVAQLLVALPQDLACRAILCVRDLDEVLDSQQRMLRRRHPPLADTPERRRLLKDEYQRTLDRAKGMLAVRPHSQMLVVSHGTAISDSHLTAERINDFLGGGLDVEKMAMAVDPTLYRNRHANSGAR